MHREFHQLPVEMIYYILTKLDGRSLGCASQVCALWHKAVSNLGQHFNIWFQVCLKEVSLDSIIAQTGLVWLASHEGRARANTLRTSWKFWRDLYVANYRCWHVNEETWHVRFQTIPLFDLGIEVTSTAAHPCGLLGGVGKYFLGFRNVESIYVFGVGDTASAENLFPCLPLSTHTNACTSLAVLTPGHHTESNDLELLHGDTHVLSSTQSGDLKVGSTELLTFTPLHGFGNQIYSISSVGRYFAVSNDSSQQGGVMVYGMAKKRSDDTLPFCDSLCHKAVLQLKGCVHSHINTVALAHDQLVGGDHLGNLYWWQFAPLYRFDMEWRRGGLRNLPETVDVPTKSLGLSYGIAQVVLHQGYVIALTNPGHSSVFVIDKEDWSRSYVVSDRALRALASDSVNSAVHLAVIANLLAVGFGSGEVVVFNTSLEDWPVNFGRCVATFFRCPAHSLTSMTFCHGAKGPTLVAGKVVVDLVRSQT